MAAYSRLVRLKGASQGSGPTTIDGAVSASWVAEAAGIKRGESDADIGYTSINITGWKGSVKLTVDQWQAAMTLAALATAAFKLTYDVADSVSGAVTQKVLTHSGINWGEVADWNLPAADGDGTVARYTASGDNVLVAANAVPSDFITVA